MAPTDLATRWKRIAASLAADLRAPYLRAEIAANAMDAVASALDRICADAEQGVPDARDLLVALVDLVAQPDFEPLAQSLREESAGRSLLALGRLLRRSLRAARAPQAAPEDRIPDYGAGRPLTLGERKSLARRPTRAALEKLLADPDPTVIRLLLANPKLVEEDVVRLAARRPNRPDVLAEIAKSPRWAHRARVRMALVLNPACPPEMAVPLVGLLVRPELQLVFESTEIAPLVRAAARELLQRRPPIKGERRGLLQ